MVAKNGQRAAGESSDVAAGAALTSRVVAGTIAATPSETMQLLVAVINHEECVEEIVAGFVEIGITGATIVESRGMGRVLSRDVPIFASGLS